MSKIVSVFAFILLTFMLVGCSLIAVRTELSDVTVEHFIIRTWSEPQTITADEAGQYLASCTKNSNYQIKGENDKITIYAVNLDESAKSYQLILYSPTIAYKIDSVPLTEQDAQKKSMMQGSFPVSSETSKKWDVAIKSDSTTECDVVDLP